jgi:hypothetical protein
MEEGVLKGKKIVFITGSSGREELMLKLSKQLKKKHNLETYFLSFAVGDTVGYFMNNGVKRTHVETIVFDETQEYKFDKFKLEEKEKLYGFKLFDLWQSVAPRRKRFLEFNDKKVLSWTGFILNHVEEYADRIKPDYVFLTGIAAFNYVIPYRVFQKKGAKIIELTNARVPGRFTFDNDLTSKWPLVAQNYQTIKKEGLNDEQRKNAQEFLSNFRDKPFRPDDSAKRKDPLKKKIKRYVQHAKVFAYRRSIPPLKPFFYYPVMDKILIHSSRFQDPVEGEKFVLFPLQIQPEASTSIRGKWFSNQVALIENLSRSIPCDHKLYVKEHFRNYSKRPRGFHDEITKFPNVRLISPKAKTIDLIKKSSLVSTINGTAGWEATLMQKPVLTFGDVFYTLLDDVYEVKDVTILPDLIKERIGKSIEEEHVLEFIAALHQGSFSGIGALPGDCQNRSLTDENIHKLVYGIEEYTKRIKK